MELIIENKTSSPKKFMVSVVYQHEIELNANGSTFINNEYLRMKGKEVMVKIVVLE